MSLTEYQGTFRNGVKTLPKNKQSAFGFSVGGITCGSFTSAITLLQLKEDVKLLEKDVNNGGGNQGLKDDKIDGDNDDFHDHENED